MKTFLSCIVDAFVFGPFLICVVFVVLVVVVVCTDCFVHTTQSFLATAMVSTQPTANDFFAVHTIFVRNQFCLVVLLLFSFSSSLNGCGLTSSSENVCLWEHSTCFGMGGGGGLPLNELVT